MADAGSVVAEVAVPEADASLIRAGEAVALKLNPYPTRLFHGKVTRPGSHVRQEGEDRFVIAEVRVESPVGLKTRDARPGEGFDDPGASHHGNVSQTRALHLETDLADPAVSTVHGSRRYLSAARPEETARALAARHGPPDARPALRKDLGILRQVQMGEVLDRQEPHDDEVQPVQRRLLANHQPVRRHPDPNGMLEAINRKMTEPVSLEFVLE